MSDIERLRTILIATNNPGKAREIAAVLSEGPGGLEHADLKGRHGTRGRRETSGEAMEDAQIDHRDPALERVGHPSERGVVRGAEPTGAEHADLGGRHGTRQRESSTESKGESAIDHRDPTLERVGHPSQLADVRWVTLRDLGVDIPEPVEDQDSFEGNSRLKAVYYSKASGLVTLADDSGLEVDALDGAPGVYSARYAEVDGEPPRAERDLANNRKLIAALAGVPETARTARFRCVLTLADGDRVLAQASGAIEGRIIDVPRGEGGFGYDPHFLVPELGKTTAELPAAHKNRISHRGMALRVLRGELVQIQKSQNSKKSKSGG